MTRPVDKTNFLNALQNIQSGSPVYETLSKYGIHVTTFKRWVKRNGFHYTNPRLREVPIQCLNDYIAGESELSIANRLGVSRNVIERFLNTHGVKRRNGSQANYIRMGKMSADERQSLVAKAHASRMGIKESEEVLIKKAITKESLTCYFGPGEDILYEALCRAGLKPIRQKAAYIYNIDFAIGSIAVELTIGTVKYQGAASNEKKRIKDLTNRGWFLVLLEFKTVEILSRYIEDVVADIKTACSHHSTGGEYWMIRGYAERYTISRDDFGKFTAVPAPVQFHYRRRIIKL